MANIDAIKLLGSLLGSGALSRGSGSNVLNSVLGAMLGGGQAGGTTAAAPQAGGGLGGMLGGMLGGGAARTAPAGGLGDLLGGMLGGGRTAAAGGQAGGGLGALLGMALSQFGGGQQGDPRAAAMKPGNLPPGLDHDQAERQAELLVRAMINAAKSDGSIDAAEQQRIVERLGEVSPEELAFVRREFEAPLDAQGFARSVPRGMEQQIYLVSLMAIDLDANAEAQYLHQLAQAFGLSAEACNRMHEQLGAPKLYR